MKLLNGFYQLCWIICHYLQMGIPTTAVHAWVLKNTDCSFRSPACDGGALPSRPTPTASQTGCRQRVSPKAAGRNCSRSTPPTLLQPAHATYPLSCCQSRIHLICSLSFKGPFCCLKAQFISALEMLWTRNVQHFRTGTFIPLGFTIWSVWPTWFANECLFPSFVSEYLMMYIIATQSMAPRSTTSASLGNLLEMQSFKLHP